MTFEKIRDLLVDALDVDTEEVTPQSDLKEDLGADSLDMVDLIMSIEDTFNIKIEESHAQSIKTVQDIVDYVSKAAA